MDERFTQYVHRCVINTSVGHIMRYAVHIMQSAPVSDDDHVCECVYCDMDITALLHTSACMVKICSAQRANSALICVDVCARAI
jgi:hypothetical protein